MLQAGLPSTNGCSLAEPTFQQCNDVNGPKVLRWPCSCLSTGWWGWKCPSLKLTASNWDDIPGLRENMNPQDVVDFARRSMVFHAEVLVWSNTQLKEKPHWWDIVVASSVQKSKQKLLGPKLPPHQWKHLRSTSWALKRFVVSRMCILVTGATSWPVIRSWWPSTTRSAH